MPDTPVYSIQAKTGNRKVPPEVLLSNSTAIYTALNGNATIPPPPKPFDLATLLAANQSLAAANAAAIDGGAKALAVRKQAKEVVVKLLGQIAKWVEANCEDNMAIFLSSGFQAKSITKAMKPPVSQWVRTLTTGPNSGQASIRPMSYPGASCVEVRLAPVPPGGVPTQWTTQPVTNLRSATIISGLTPGTMYAFQVRAIVQSAYTDWSDSVTLMAV